MLLLNPTFLLYSANGMSEMPLVLCILATLALYLESSIAIWEIWLGGFMLFSGYLVPLELFPPWVERIARLLPFAYLQAVTIAPVECFAFMQYASYYWPSIFNPDTGNGGWVLAVPPIKRLGSKS